jgi:hypothetical protein
MEFPAGLAADAAGFVAGADLAGAGAAAFLSLAALAKPPILSSPATIRAAEAFVMALRRFE